MTCSLHTGNPFCFQQAFPGNDLCTWGPKRKYIKATTKRHNNHTSSTSQYPSTLNTIPIYLNHNAQPQRNKTHHHPAKLHTNNPTRILPRPIPRLRNLAHPLLPPAKTNLRPQRGYSPLPPKARRSPSPSPRTGRDILYHRGRGRGHG